MMCAFEKRRMARREAADAQKTAVRKPYQIGSCRSCCFTEHRTYTMRHNTTPTKWFHEYHSDVYSPRPLDVGKSSWHHPCRSHFARTGIQFQMPSRLRCVGNGNCSPGQRGSGHNGTKLIKRCAPALLHPNPPHHTKRVVCKNGL